MTNYQSRKLRKEYVTFLEKAGIDEEKKIQSEVNRFFTELNRRNFKLVYEQVSPDVEVNSFYYPRKVLRFPQYKRYVEYMMKRENTLFLDDIAVSINRDNISAKVDGALAIVSYRRTKRLGCTIQFIKTNDRWLIKRLESYP